MIELPNGDHAQPDFLYEEHSLAIHIDGPPHDTPEQQKNDRRIDAALNDLGIVSLRFHHARKGEWSELMDQHSYAFGNAQTGGAS